MYKTLIKRSSSHFFTLILGKLISTAVFIYLARTFTPSELGNVVLYLTYISLGTLLADFGLNQWYQKTRHFFSKESQIHDILSGRFLTLLIAIVLLTVVIYLTKSFSMITSIILMITLLPEALLSVFDGYYFSEKKPLKVSGKIVLRNILFLIGLLALPNLQNMDYLFTLYLVSNILTLLWYLPYHLIVKWKLSLSRGIKILKESAQYALLIVTSFAYARGDSLVIEYSLGSAFLGYYSSAYRYLDALSLAPTALAQNLFHISAKKNAVTLSELYRIIATMTFVGVVVSSCLYASSTLLTTALLGNSYQYAAPLVKIFSYVLVLFFINSPLSTIVQSSNIFKSFLPWGIMNTVSNVVLNILLVPMYGMVAAAWIMFLTEISGLVINLFFVRKIYRET